MLKKLLAAAVVAATLTAAHAEVKTIKDVLGREVKVDVPAKRIMLGFYYTDYLAVGGEKALDNVVGFSKAVWTDWTPASWEVYSKALPKLKELADVGEVEVGTFSVEKVLALKPDLVVLADWQWQAIEDDRWKKRASPLSSLTTTKNNCRCIWKAPASLAKSPVRKHAPKKSPPGTKAW